jgi:hypothetical protein
MPWADIMDYGSLPYILASWSWFSVGAIPGDNGSMEDMLRIWAGYSLAFPGKNLSEELPDHSCRILRANISLSMAVKPLIIFFLQLRHSHPLIHK